MKHNSISIRHEIYFRLLALLDLLWSDNFKEEAELNSQAVDVIEKIGALATQLQFLAQRHAPEHQSDSLRTEHTEPKLAAKQEKR